MELTHFVLVTGPFVGRSSMLDTARALREAGAMVTEPDPHVVHAEDLPTLEDWANSLLPAIPAPPPIIVGYGAGTVLAAWLASRIDAAGLILMDGEIPPDAGPCPILPEPVTVQLRKLAKGDRLPKWSDWWPEELAEPLGKAALRRMHPELRDILAGEEREFPIDWLDQRLDLDRWSGVPTGYLRLSDFYRDAAQDAAARGWPVEEVEGSHLHPAMMGNDTAGALMAVAGAF